MKKNRLKGMILNSFNASGKWKALTWLLIVLVMSSVELYANGQKKLNVVMKNASIEEVFNAIEKQSEYRFLYKTDLVDIDKKITINQKNADINAVLKEVFAGTNIYFSLKEGDLVIVTPAAARIEAGNQQEDQVVKGKVVDVNGESLPGVSVFIKGTTNGTITDIDGNYQLTVPAGDQVIVFSFIGMKSEEVTFAGQPTINITLMSSVEEMDEVVVVAYGTQKKSNLTGSVQSVSSEKLKDASTPSVSQLLQGKASGVYVVNESGRPGSSPKIRIRGKGSFSGSVDPLWVIDGVVSGTGSQLSPSEIETISILKDASATALYGSRAANGVIIVTTKTAKKGMNKFNVTANVGYSHLNDGNFSLMNSQELYDYHGKWNTNADYYSEDLLNNNTDWLDIATQTGVAKNFNISYLGGNDKVRTAIIGDYYNETGAVKGYEYERYTTRFNMDYTINEKLELHAKLSGSYWNDDNRQHSLYQAYYNLPWDTPYNEDGSIRTGKESDWIGRDNSNYLYDLQWNWSRGKQLGVKGIFGFDYKIMEGLTFTSNNNIGYNYAFTESYTDPKSNAGKGEKGLLSNGQELRTSRYTNQLLKWNKALDLHNFTAFIGYEYSDYLYEQFDAKGKSLPSGFEVLDATGEAAEVGGKKSESAMQSYLFNANYIYNNRYMAQFSIRRDGHSSFSPSKRYGNFYTVSAGWSIHEEAFMQGVEWVNSLKLRASYGEVGNLPGTSYGYWDIYPMTYSYNTIPAPFPKQLASDEFRWERVKTTNIAIDTRIFDRMNLTVEWYNKNTSDLTHKVPLNTGVYGFKEQWLNVGGLNNKGIEVVIGAELIKTTDLQWNMDFNIGFNKNKVTDIYEKQPIDSGYKRLTLHEDMDSFYLRKWMGVDSQNGKPLWEKIDEIDEDGDGNVDRIEKSLTSDWNAATRQLVGSSAPDYFGGLMTDVTYKSFTLSANFNFVQGNYTYHQAREYFDADGAYPTYNVMNLHEGWSRWEKPGDIATHPETIAGGNSMSNKTSSRYLEDGSYIRLRNLTLAYNLPKTLLDRVKLKSAKFSVSGENLLTITDYSGMDPEVGEKGEADGGFYPLTQRIVFGLNIEF